MTPPRLLDRAPEVIAMLATFGTLSTLAIMLRSYCRMFVVKSFGVDDYAAIFAWVAYVFFVAFGIASAYHGSGVHASKLASADIIIGVKWWWVCEPIYVVANMALKLSICVFLLRIAVSKTHRAIIWTVIIVTEVYCTFFFLLFIFQCTPVEHFWTRYTGTTGYCINPHITVNALYAYSAISCAADWTIGVLPVFLVWNLQMDRSTKVSVACILFVGAFASIATVVRIAYVPDLLNEDDFLYAVTDVAVWSTCETGIGISTSCVATLRPLYIRYCKKGSANPYANPMSNGWAGKKSNSGYIRSQNKGAFHSEIALSEDIGKTIQVTTVVENTMENKGGDKSSTSSWNPNGDVEEGWGGTIVKSN